MALKYTLKTARIEIDGPESYIEVRGLSPNHIVQLLQLNRPSIERLFNEFSNRDVSQITEEEVIEAGMGMIEQAPALVAHIIALAADAVDQFDEVVALPVGVQIAALERIADLTFTAGGGPKKVLALATKLMGSRQSGTPQP